MTSTDTTSLAYYRAIRIMFSKKSPAEGLKDLDLFVRKLIPHPAWDKIQTIPFNNELPQLMEWVKNGLQAYQENFPILFFCISDMGDVVSLFFLQQTREIQKGLGFDWDAYSENFYADAPSKVLKQMYQIAEVERSNKNKSSHDVGWIVETCYPLVYAGLVVSEIMRKLPIEIVLGKHPKRQVAVFFGEGDDFMFGEITKSGFKNCEIPSFVK
jgi:hypothetical protein